MPLETEISVQVLLKVREQKPVVHTITNLITANEVATALHAIGARPIMAFAAEEKDPMVAAVSALDFFGLAEEQAALQTDGPGTFKSVFFDTLFSLTPDQMRKGMKIKV